MIFVIKFSNILIIIILNFSKPDICHYYYSCIIILLLKVMLIVNFKYHEKYQIFKFVNDCSN
jgi:hypothetical protein